MVAKIIERVTIPGILLHYALRKKCIARLARAALTNGVRQVVVLGAGFDSLGLELSREFLDAHFWELDHPATQRAKTRALPRIDNQRLHLVPIDLSAAPVEQEVLVASGFDQRQCTFWVAEGLFMYFPAAVVSSLLRTLAKLSASGSQIVFTFMERQSNGRIQFRSQSRFVDFWLGKRREPFLWGSTRAELSGFVRPWSVARIFDDNDLREMEPAFVKEQIARGELICLAQI